jgi:hypothetical protein
LASLTLIVIGCTAELRDPVGLTGGTGGGTTSGGGGGGGTSSGGSAAEALVGSWENLIVIGMSGDFQTIRTRWDFQRSGACRKTVRTFSVLDGVDFTTVRDCNFTINNGNVIVTFTDSMSSVSFSLSFPGFMSDRILLGGIEFDRSS